MVKPYRCCRVADWIVLVALSLSFLPQASAHKKVYKYQDEQGIWHVAEIRPAILGTGEGKQHQAGDSKHKLIVQQRGSNKEPLFYFVNAYNGPVQVEVELTRLDNLQPVPPPPKRFMLPAASEMMAFSLRPVQPGQSGSYSFTYRSVIGDPNAEHDPAARYRPPFAPGQSFHITQGFNGGFTHNDAQNRYAVDIALPEGSPVYAARAGVVMEVIDQYKESGVDKDKYAGKANWVRILHDDGTMSVYAHLKYKSARVRPGTRVEEGQLIAQSGNTGLSTGPHLHFVVQKNADMDLISLPFLFKDARGQDVKPEKGVRLAAF
jgi:murein DD-endopeptidase MepM/ murein hydrolase activator NlpD